MLLIIVKKREFSGIDPKHTKGRPQNKKDSFWLTFSRPPPPPAKSAFKKYKIGSKADARNLNNPNILVR